MTAPHVAELTERDAERLLFREARLLDNGDWDAWLALYTEDSTFWMPAWRNEAETTGDPDRELSLIYYAGRRGIEERVWRARSGLSVASTPRPRVVHAVTNVLLEGEAGGEWAVSACFTVHLYDPRSGGVHVNFGRYDYRLRHGNGNGDGGNGGWLIAAKTITLLNDRIPTVVDFYSV
ncbi:aromatic-ring-hydroxylating dioxygenase subunit beta [Novosphingobium lentum]|uniref:aromatic-ring-hydroxylating dioxygenase subunit beta n=1 Tax=Novosphingobium lentum TaxID=145287 RepID=UPI000832E175|nr:aromatic-ring-hydroxylating dioxygenase subunit beta [Novosphingobium lentum]